MTASRAEQAKPEEARGLLEELWDELAPKLWPKVTHDLHCRAETFARLLDINTPEAHLAAAMMLVPEGAEFGLNWSRMNVDMGGKNWRCHVGKERASGRTPALALISAIARSMGQ